MRTPRFFSIPLSILCCVFPSTVNLAGADLEVTVAAGKWDRRSTPVFLEVDAAVVREKSGAVVTSRRGPQQPAQIVPDADRARIWWIVDELGAWQERDYEISLLADSPGGEKAFRWQAGQWQAGTTAKGGVTDLMFGKRPVLRYMHAAFDPENIELTKKPFHHVFTPSGDGLITKGAGGLYSHHRGIYFGYNKCEIDGKVCDTWHAKQGEHQEHQEVLRAVAGPVFGGHLVTIEWRDRAAKTFIREERSIHTFRQPDGQLLIEFHSTLHPTRGPVSLGGDRQHAGVQFRASQKVAENETATRYLRPHGWSHLPPAKQINSEDHKDLPWNAIQFPLGDRKYTVAYLSDPKNPDGADFSERPYGRFGEFFPWKLTEDNLLTVRYRWWITDSPDVSRLDIRGRYHDLADPPTVRVKK